MKREDYDLAYMLQYEHVAWYEKGTVSILDRRIYPREVAYVRCARHEEVAQAIADMVTQSAGPYTAASMGMALAAYEVRDCPEVEQINHLKQAAYTLSHARPTTVQRMTQITDGCLKVALQTLKDGGGAMGDAMRVDEAIFLHTIESMNRRYRHIHQVAQHLVDKFPQRGSIMTQCFGETIVGMMLREARERNLDIKLFCPETRPYLQGARLTASVAQDMGFDVTVITDNMPAAVMAGGAGSSLSVSPSLSRSATNCAKGIDLFTSAADSICMDGYIVNKVGTLQIAIVAQHFGVPYYVTGIPDKGLTIDQVTIEERNPEEALACHGIKHTMQGVQGYYPAFDITPPELVTGVVTDKGIFDPTDLASYYDGECAQYW